MKSVNTYYVNLKTLQNFLNEHSMKDSPSLLIQVFTSKNDKSYIQTLINALVSILPKATIIGSTTDGEIMNAKVSTHKTVLSFTQFNYTTLKTDTRIHKNDGYFSGQYLAKSLIQEDTKLILAFANGVQTNGELFLEGINSVNSEVIVAGGLAGDNATFTETYVFTKDQIINKGAVAVAFNSDTLTVSNGYSFNWHRIGKELTITKVVDNRVYTINNITAVEMYTYYLGEEMATALPAIGIEFPLIFRRNGVEVARAVLAKHDDGSLTFAGNLHTGDKVQFGYGNPSDILRNSDKLFHQIQEKPSEAIFIYSCMARRHFMPDLIHEEIELLQHISPTVGFFTYGEFYTGKRKELLNQSMTIVSLSEDKIVSSPKVSVLHHEKSTLYSINALINLVNRTSEESMKEESLKQARYTFEKLFESSPDGILLLENDIFVQCNQKMLDLFGYETEKKFVEGSAYQLFPRKQPDGSYSLVKLKKMRELAKKNGSHQFEWVHLKENGETFWVDIMLTYLILNGKEILYMVYRDITDRKELEKENTSIKEQMELAFEGNRDGLWDWNIIDNSVYFSVRWKEMLGYSDEELDNNFDSWQKNVHPDDLEEVLQEVQLNIEGKREIYESKHRLRHRDGHWVWIYARGKVYFNSRGIAIRMIGTHTDITEEKELQLRHFQQAQIIDQIHDGIITTDLGGYIISWNEGAEKLFEYTKNEVMGKHISLIYRQEDIPSLKQNIRASLSDTGLYNGDLIFVKKSKKTISVALSLSTLKDEHNQVIGMIGINQDITQRKKAEIALYEAKQKAEESTKSKSEFLANMSHEIRTPLNAILGFITLLKEENLGETPERYVDIIDSSSKGLLKIIEDILDFSKIESGKLEIDKIAFNVKEEFEIIKHVFLAKCSENDIELSFTLDENIPKLINSDPLRLKQVIFNLLSNAVKFTGKGKKILVDIHYKDAFLNVSVKDEGKGIAKDKLSHIFESFSQEDSSTTREYGGTGLGLSISYELVKLLDGELKVNSLIGIGSEFYFSIRAEEAEELEFTEDTLAHMTFDNRRILLVEDMITSQIFMNIILNELNFEVDIANDGLEAVEAFKKNKYDVILMDENMPNLNGLGATKQILEIEAQNNSAHTPIVALTANALKGDKERFITGGMDGYLTKPVEKKELSKALKKVLM